MGMEYLLERQAITQTINQLLKGTDRAERAVLIDGQMYRVTAERLTDIEDIRKAVSQYVKEAPEQRK